MFSGHKLVVFIFFFSGMLLFSCNKEEDRIKELLQQHDWEQLTILPWDTAYSMHKYFYTLRFNADETYYMEANWSYVTVRMTIEAGRYEYNPGRDAIIFPDPVDTCYFDELGGFYYIFFSPWNILEINDTILIIEADSVYAPPYSGDVWGEGDSLVFRPKPGG